VTLLGRKVKSVDRTDGAKFTFEDGTWMLLRLSGTEPLLRLYVEAESAAASAKLVKEATEWILKDERKSEPVNLQALWHSYGGLCWRYALRRWWCMTCLERMGILRCDGRSRK